MFPDKTFFRLTLAFTVVLSSGSVFCAERRLSVAAYRDKMQAGWIGQIAGVAWGAPTEFKCQHRIVPADLVPVWSPDRINEGFGQDDLYVEMTFLRTLERHGLGVSSHEAGIDFANSRYHLWHANEEGRNLLREGIAPPDSSHPSLNPCANDIDYQIEADFSGLVSPGCPRNVIALGETFGRMMNYGDGLYAGQFVGAMYAEAFFETNRIAVVERALKAIPSGSRYAEMVRDLLLWYREDRQDWEKAWKRIEEKYAHEGGCKAQPDVIDATLNGAQILLGYLWGDGDPDRTILLSMRGGFDSDCNPSSAGGVLFTSLGLGKIPARFYEALDKTRKFDYTDYDFTRLVAVCEKIAREVVVASGGRLERDAAGVEWFVLPEQEPVPSACVSFFKPGPLTNSRYTEEECGRILYRPILRKGHLPGEGWANDSILKDGVK